MKDHEGCFRGFTQLSKMWYAGSCLRTESIKDELTIGFYHPDGGTTGEFAIRWVNLSDTWVPEMRVFDDAWSALNGFKDVIEKLAAVDNENCSTDEIATILESCGVKNMNEPVRPVRRRGN